MNFAYLVFTGDKSSWNEFTNNSILWWIGQEYELTRKFESTKYINIHGLVFSLWTIHGSSNLFIGVSPGTYSGSH